MLSVAIPARDFADASRLQRQSLNSRSRNAAIVRTSSRARSLVGISAKTRTRFSGTEPRVRIFAEMPTRARARELVRVMAAFLRLAFHD